MPNFHAGEVQLQNESGVDAVAFERMVAEPFLPELNPNEARFVNQRSMSIAATVDHQGRPWASPLLGQPGELFCVHNSTTVHIVPQPIPGDPLTDNINDTGELGVLYFDPSRRRRAKSLGRAVIKADGTIVYTMRRNFGLCNKYIFKRSHQPAVDAVASTAVPTLTAALTAPDRTQLETADTIFLASHHADHGTDPTHRGGPIGFVTVIDDSTLSIPDYLGNGMFQTLGNLLLDDRIGLLSIDFASGRTVAITGRGSIQKSDTNDEFSTRTLRIAIDETRTTWPSIGQWTDIEAFELRPGLINPATPMKPNAADLEA